MKRNTRKHIYLSTHLAFQYSDALVLERLRELNNLCSLWVDGQRCHNHVRPVCLIYQLANQTRPLLLTCKIKSQMESFLLANHYIQYITTAMREKLLTSHKN